MNESICIREKEMRFRFCPGEHRLALLGLLLFRTGNKSAMFIYRRDTLSSSASKEKCSSGYIPPVTTVSQEIPGCGGMPKRH